MTVMSTAQYVTACMTRGTPQTQRLAMRHAARAEMFEPSHGIS